MPGLITTIIGTIISQGEGGGGTGGSSGGSTVGVGGGFGVDPGPGGVSVGAGVWGGVCVGPGASAPVVGRGVAVAVGGGIAVAVGGGIAVAVGGSIGIGGVGVVSTTVRLNAPARLLPDASVAVQFTRVVPRGNVSPDAGLHTTTGAGSAMSVAVAAKVWAAPAGLAASTVASDGSESSGGVVSETVTLT